jgi:hypothetical protein
MRIEKKLSVRYPYVNRSCADKRMHAAGHSGCCQNLIETKGVNHADTSQ